MLLAAHGDRSPVPDHQFPGDGQTESDTAGSTSIASFYAVERLEYVSCFGRAKTDTVVFHFDDDLAGSVLYTDCDFLLAPGILVCIREEVEDDGVGFDTSEEDDLQAEPGRFGLFSISERLRNVGGRFGIDAKPGGGTKVTVVVPSQPEILGG